MKRLVLSVLAALLLVSPAANATLTNSSVYIPHGNVDVYSALITATANDTTATADSNTIFNQDGSITGLSAGVKATNQTGTSPTLTVSFIGSFDNATWFALKSGQGSTAGTVGTMDSGALTISTASTTNVATGLSIGQFGLLGSLLPPYIRVRVAVGGTSTPGWTGVAYATVRRGK